MAHARALAGAQRRLPPRDRFRDLGPDGLTAKTRLSSHCLHEQLLPRTVRDAFDNRQYLGDEPGAPAVELALINFPVDELFTEHLRSFDAVILQDIDAARYTLEHGDARGRSSASEYLDNILSGPLRKVVLPVLEDMPLEERVRRGNVIVKTRPRDVEETLLQLINDEDPVTASAAIDVVREHKLWNLADDVEHVLAHRDARDQDVFEAASWALAANRVDAAKRRQLWQEPLPAVELADRLRRVPLFDFTMNMPLCTVPLVLVLAMMKSPARSIVAAPLK